jgi:hypothetical protein
MAFLTHYQLSIRYEIGTKILSSFKQSSSTHISDHIHEWRRRRRLIKVPLPDQLLAEWFTKSLIGPISHDVSMGGVVTEEKAISRAQYLDLVYSQTGTLYDLIPDAPRPSTNPTPTPPTTSHAVDGVIDTFHAKTQSAHMPVTPIPNLIILIYKILLLLLLPPVRLLRLILFNPQLSGRIKIKRKGRVRTRRKRIIIHNLINSKCKPLMRNININLVTLSLFVVTIITQKIFHDVLRSLSSSKGPKILYTYHFITTFPFSATSPIGHL